MILDLDEKAIDSSNYEAGLVVSDASFNPKTWEEWTKAEQAKAVPGAASRHLTALGGGARRDRDFAGQTRSGNPP